MVGDVTRSQEARTWSRKKRVVTSSTIEDAENRQWKEGAVSDFEPTILMVRANNDVHYAYYGLGPYFFSFRGELHRIR